MLPLRNCTRCGTALEATPENFYPQKGCLYGLTPTCRACTNAMRTDWKRRNATRLASRRREIYAERYGPRQRELEAKRAERVPYKVQASALASGIYSRSRENGWPKPAWVSPKAIEAWLRAQPNCECCAVPLRIGRKGGGRSEGASPSFDRFDSARSYERSNVRLICWRCNNIKRNYSAADLRMVAGWIERSTWGNQTDKFAADQVAA